MSRFMVLQSEYVDASGWWRQCFYVGPFDLKASKETVQFLCQHSASVYSHRVAALVVRDVLCSLPHPPWVILCETELDFPLIGLLGIIDASSQFGSSRQTAELPKFSITAEPHLLT